MFPDDHTKLEGIIRYQTSFFMGMLVVRVIEKIGIVLNNKINHFKIELVNR
jgi:hypothetical protein